MIPIPSAPLPSSRLRPPINRSAPSRQPTKTAWISLPLVLVLFVGAGCTTTSQSGSSTTAGLPIHLPWLPKPKPPAFKARNHASSFATMPKFVRRVAVLPIAYDDGADYGEYGSLQLQPVLQSELGKLNRFELLPLSPRQVRNWTGQRTWGAEEALPKDFFEILRRETGSDAVLFTRLQPYHPYRPLVMGWQMVLVDTRIQTVIWAADEVFDAANSSVAQGAREYYTSQQQDKFRQDDPERILLSPRGFGQYTLDTILASVPARKND